MSSMSFNGPYDDIWMRLGNAFVVCDLNALYLQSHQFLIQKAILNFLSYFGLKTPFLTFSLFFKMAESRMFLNKPLSCQSSSIIRPWHDLTWFLTLF